MTVSSSASFIAISMPAFTDGAVTPLPQRRRISSAALALGGDTVKLKYGHRGGNQPVRDLAAGRTYITSQNHGYAVVADSLKGIGNESFRNANDNSCEGMDYPELDCFTVQFHPEAASGPRDTAILFDRFVERMMKKNA